MLIQWSYIIKFVWWCLTPFSTIFQLYRGSQFYWWRKPPTCRKSLTNSITPRPGRDSNSQYQWWQALIAQVIQLPYDHGHDGPYEGIARFIFKYYNNHFERTWWRLRTKFNINVCFCFIDFILYKSYRVLICIFINQWLKIQ